MQTESKTTGSILLAVTLIMMILLCVPADAVEETLSTGVIAAEYRPAAPRVNESVVIETKAADGEASLREGDRKTGLLPRVIETLGNVKARITGNGTVRERYRDGTLKRETVLRKGKEVSAVEYYRTGLPGRVSVREDGRETVRSFYINGVLQNEEVFEDGSFVEGRRYDETGDLTVTYYTRPDETAEGSAPDFDRLAGKGREEQQAALDNADVSMTRKKSADGTVTTAFTWKSRPGVTREDVVSADGSATSSEYVDGRLTSRSVSESGGRNTAAYTCTYDDEGNLARKHARYTGGADRTTVVTEYDDGDMTYRKMTYDKGEMVYTKDEAGTERISEALYRDGYTESFEETFKGGVLTEGRRYIDGELTDTYTAPWYTDNLSFIKDRFE